MSMAKIQKLRDRILRRGWQLTERFDKENDFYITQISGIIIDAGGERCVWTLQNVLDASKLLWPLMPPHEVWVRHFTSMIHEAEKYLAEAERKIAVGEKLHVSTPSARPVENSADEARPSGDNSGTRGTGSNILDPSGNRIS